MPECQEEGVERLPQIETRVVDEQAHVDVKEERVKHKKKKLSQRFLPRRLLATLQISSSKTINPESANVSPPKVETDNVIPLNDKTVDLKTKKKFPFASNIFGWFFPTLSEENLPDLEPVDKTLPSNDETQTANSPPSNNETETANSQNANGLTSSYPESEFTDIDLKTSEERSNDSK